MSGNFALIGSDQRLASAVLAQLKAAHSHLVVAQHSHDTVREHLERNSGVSLALLVSSPADAEHAVRLVQEVAIRKMPTRIVVVQADATSHSETLDHLKAHPVPRLSWPSD